MMIELEPIGIVRSERKDAIDDEWNDVHSWIELDRKFSEESLAGLSDFSHIEILYFFHKVDKTKIILTAERPRENPDWPKVGIFAQRKKARPNLIGATISRLVKIEGRKIYLESFDAIDGTPVIDIKPVFSEYLPEGKVTQPAWTHELMRHYW